MQEYQRIISTLVLDRTLYMKPITPIQIDMLHCGHSIMGTHRRHTLEISHPLYPETSSVDAWIYLDKDVHCNWMGVNVSKMMVSLSRDHWQWVSLTIIASPFGIVCFYNNSKYACYCSILCGGCQSGKWWRSILRVTTFFWITTTCLFVKQPVVAHIPSLENAQEWSPIPQICCIGWLLCTNVWLWVRDTLIGWRQ